MITGITNFGMFVPLTDYLIDAKKKYKSRKFQHDDGASRRSRKSKQRSRKRR